MGSTSHSCEIVKLQEDQSRREHTQGMHHADNYMKEGKGGPKHTHLKPVATQRDDIDQLFKSINLRGPRSSLGKSFEDGSSPFRKSSMKRPIRAGAPFSPASEISEQVTLKQALRGLCISQASEMAAMKRLSKSVNNSPRISEAGKIKSLYKSVLVETGECSRGVGDMVDITVVPEGNSTLTSLDRGTHTPQELLRTSTHPSANSSPRHSATPSNLNPLSSVVGKKTLKEELAQTDDHENGEVLASKAYRSTLEDSAAAADAASKASLAKVGQKSKRHNVPLSPNAVNVKRLTKLSRKSPRLVKPGSRKRIIAKKRLDHESSPSSGTSINNEVDSITMHGTMELVCQRCQCALKNIDKKTVQGPAESHFGSAGAKLSLSCATPDTSGMSFTSSACSSRILGDANKSSKEKGEFSQSSISSLGDYSTTTSISEDSNLSRSSCSNRPHMSKDVRWEAIRHAKRQHGTLGLKNFNLLKKLGCGDIGTVYLAELIGTNYPFAIKVMDNEYLARRKKMPRARAEREILRMLDHPFLPTLYAQFTSDNLSCLVMEYCPGGDLHVLRQKQPGRNFTEPAARFYVAEVLLALEYLHMLGVVYRDLKPENILVREDGHIMLTDFDLSLRCDVSPTLLKSSTFVMEPARISGPCTGSNCIDPFCIKPSCQGACFSPRILPSAVKARKQKSDRAAHARLLPLLVAEPTEARSNSFVGTHEYLAPEIIKGEGHGSAVDWWTFGIFLYELLYGKTPFKGSGNEETLANVVIQSLKFPDTPLVSFQARDLIRGLLVKEPEHRLGSQRGAADIKQHPFFEGLNWALIRCALPPELPSFSDYNYGFSSSISAAQGEDSKYLDCSATGDQLEFELF